MPLNGMLRYEIGLEFRANFMIFSHKYDDSCQLLDNFFLQILK